MRILMVSMNSIHFQRWTNQLKESGHEVFWFDIKDGVEVPVLNWVTVFQKWKLKFPNLRGRHWLKKRLPKVHGIIENNTAKAFEKVLLEVKPDIVHSFVLYISCAPILEVMQKHNTIKWIYSSWGSDLYYFKNIPKYRNDIEAVLPRINYLFTDCKRDVLLAKKMGFKGSVLGTLPGGGGYDLSVSDKYIKRPVLKRNVIVVKGYQGRSGRAIEVLKALEQLTHKLVNFQVVVFGADEDVENFVLNNIKLNTLDIKVFSKVTLLAHNSILEFMGKALLYIGNSESDGVPNTLLESVILGAFPIQSNPGGASEDIIKHNENGLLIQDCHDIKDIKFQIETALDSPDLIENGFQINQTQLKPKLEINHIKKIVLEAYQSIQDNEH